MVLKAFNLGNIQVDEKSGRISFGGIASGIDTENMVKAFRKAREAPIDRIDDRVDKTIERIKALDEMRDKVNRLNQAVSTMRGEISYGHARDVFENKLPITRSVRTAAGGGAPTDAKSLVSVSVDNDAEIGKHRLEILQKATVHSIRSNRHFALTRPDPANPGRMTQVPLGVSGQMRLAATKGDVTAAPVIRVLASDTLYDLRDKINAAARNGNNNLRAEIVTTNTGIGTLVIQSTAPGEAIRYDDAGRGLLFNLGIVASNVPGAEFAVTTSHPQPARFRFNGASSGEWETRPAPVASHIAAAAAGQQVRITDSRSGASVTLNIVDADGNGQISVRELADSLSPRSSNPIQLIRRGITDPSAYEGYAHLNFGAGNNPIFNVVLEREGTDVRIRAFATERDARGRSPIDGERRAVSMTFVGPNADQFNNFMRDSEVITRNTNNVDNVVRGVKLDLLNAEPGTTIELDIEPNRQNVKDAISEFVESYNELRRFINQQRQIDERTREPLEDAHLYGTAALRQLEGRLSLMMADSAQGRNLQLRSLAQIGVEFVDNKRVADNLDEETLQIDESKLIDAINNRFDDVKNLFSMTIQSSDGRVQPLAFTSETRFAHLPNVALRINIAGGAITGATYTHDGIVSDVDVRGRSLIFSSGPAKGLALYYSGDLTAAGAVDIRLTSTLGIAENFYEKLDTILDKNPKRPGLIQAEYQSYQQTNAIDEARIKSLTEKLDDESEDLTHRFERMEKALALLDAQRAQISALFGLNGKN